MVHDIVTKWVHFTLLAILIAVIVPQSIQVAGLLMLLWGIFVVHEAEVQGLRDELNTANVQINLAKISNRPPKPPKPPKDGQFG